jgi:hypothetical protein
MYARLATSLFSTVEICRGAFLFGVPGCVRRGACRLLQFGSASTRACCKHGACYKLAASTAVASAQF